MMKKVFFLLLIALSFCKCDGQFVVSSSTQRIDVRPHVPVYIISVSQSNGGGRGTPASLTAPYQLYLANVKIFQTASQTWQDLKAGVNNYGSSAGAGFGMEIYLGTSLQAYKGGTIYIIKYCVDGTPVAVDPGPDWNVASSGELLDNLKTIITNANASFTALGLIPDYKSVHIMQGETDALTLSYANAYQTNLENIISNLRTFMGLPNLKFVINKIEYPAAPYLTTVQNFQAIVGAETNCAFNSASSSYPLQGDLIHYTTAGEISLGTDNYTICKDY